MTLAARIFSGLALALAVVAYLPMPWWPLWQLRFAAIETRALPVLLGLLAAILALRTGEGRALAVGLLGLGLAAVPLGTSLRFASQLGVPLSLQAYLAGHSDPSVEVDRDVKLRAEQPDLVVDVYRGAGDRSGAPWVLVIHGGSWQHGDKGEVAHVSRFLAGSGITVFDLRYRLAPASPFPAALQDVLRAVCAIQAQADTWGVDPALGALLGRSAGGHLALLAANAPEELRPACEIPTSPIRGVVSLYAPVDLAWSWAHPPSPDVLHNHDTLRAFLGGSPEEIPETYAQASPNLHLDASSPPVLLLHGISDRLVRPAHAGFFAEAMKRVGRSARLIEIPSADHGFDVRPGGVGEQIARQEILRFLRASLAPQEEKKSER